MIEQTSIVRAPVERVWARIITPEGINDEMRPWLTMSPPRGRQLTIDTVETGVPLGRCWLRLLGVLPLDFDDLMIAEVDMGRSFHETSTMLSMSRWEHERTLTPAGGSATLVHDRVTFLPRLPLIARLLRPVVDAFFAHRHRRLARHFG